MLSHTTLSTRYLVAPSGRLVTRRLAATLLATSLLGATILLASPVAGAAQPAVGLGTAESFAVLAGEGITNTGPTTITGDVGTFPTTDQTGFASVTMIGTNHAGDAVTQGAKTDLVTAYNDAAGRTPATSVPVELGNTTKLPGVYTSPTFGLTGTLTLDGGGDPDAEFVFQAGSTLITASNSRVLFINGADPCAVVWQVGSSATFGTGTAFVGDVLAMASITATTGATFNGRLLARDGAVTLDTNTITRSVCAADTTTTTADDTTSSTADDTTTSTTTGDTTTSTSTTVASTATSTTGPSSPGSPAATPGAPGTPGAPDSGTDLTTATPTSPPTTTGRPALPFTGMNPWVAVVGGLILSIGILMLGASARRADRFLAI